MKRDIKAKNISEYSKITVFNAMIPFKHISIGTRNVFSF